MMSRIPKWKIEKTKVKVVFRLQFHATQIPQTGWDKLFVSFIPVDIGKVTSKTSKVSVRNGNCKWSDPIYETTRLLQDPKTKDYDEKLYKLVVAMGSSRSSILGDVVINLADFADALKPSSTALPLLGCEFGTILHVTVQLLTSKTGFREFEQQRELIVKGSQGSGRIHEPAEVMRATSGATEQMDKVNTLVTFKGNSVGLPFLTETSDLDEVYDLAARTDGPSHISENFYVGKSDASSTPEIDSSLKFVVSGDVGFAPVDDSSTEKGVQNDKQLSMEISNDRSHGWNSEYSVAHDLTSTCEDNQSLNVRLQVAESAFLQLKSEAMSLKNISDDLYSETHNLSQQLTIELASGKKLAREISNLKSEYLKLKNIVEQVAVALAAQRTVPFPVQMKKCCREEASMENKLVNGALVAEPSNHCFASQSKLLQGIFLIECKVRQILNKTGFGNCGNELNNLFEEFDVLVRLIQNLKQCFIRESDMEPGCGFQATEAHFTCVLQTEHYPQGQGMPRCLIDPYNTEGVDNEKMSELLDQLEALKSENESLAKKMAQMECYYEALIHELEEGQKQTANQLENLTTEHSSCFFTISALQNQTEKLNQDMNEQLISFAKDRHNLRSFIEELENRAISSETMLRRVRRNYAVAVDRLQKDLELLSIQVLSMYEANENLAKQAFLDAFEQQQDGQSKQMKLCETYECLASIMQQQQTPVHDIVLTQIEQQLPAVLNGVSHTLLRTSLEENKCLSQTGFAIDSEFQVNREPDVHLTLLKLQENTMSACKNNVLVERKNLLFPKGSSMETQWDTSHLQNLDFQDSHCNAEKFGNMESMAVACFCRQPENQPLDNRSGFEDRELASSQQLLASKQAELSEVRMNDVHLEIYAEILEETLHNVFMGIGHMNGKVVELQLKIEDCTKENELLALKLQAALDEAKRLLDAERQCKIQHSNLLSENHLMELKLNDALHENSFLRRNVADCQGLIAEIRVFESNYKDCFAEKNELQDLLNEEQSQRKYLQGTHSSLVEEFKSLKELYDKQCSLTCELQNLSTYLKGKLVDLCSSMILCSQKINYSLVDDALVKNELETEKFDALSSYLKQFQLELCCRLVKLQQEKNVAEEQIEAIKHTLNEKESHNAIMKMKFELELDEIREKLDLSNKKVQHLQVELQVAEDKLSHCKEAEEMQSLENEALFSRVSAMEIELQQATKVCEDFSQKLSASESVYDEYTKVKFNLMECMQHNVELVSSIESGNRASMEMEKELSSLKITLHDAQDKLQSEKKHREQLEVSVADFKLQLERTSEQLVTFDEQKSELCYLRTRVLDLERDLQYSLAYHAEREQKINAESSSQTAIMENHLVAAIEHSISADVELTFVRNQFYYMTMNVVLHQEVLKNILEELHLKHLNADISLERYITGEIELVAEKERLSAALRVAKSKIKAISSEKESLISYMDANMVKRMDFEDMKTRAVNLEACYAEEKQQYEDEICMLKSLLQSTECFDELLLSNVELDIMVLLFRSKWIEHVMQMSLFKDYDYELCKLREQCVDLNQKLSEQILKTEEFKSLSVHLRELKDKADVECHQSRERRVSEGSSLDVQESLRIAFIKEQYESKLQELRNQCSISKKYAEELLFKLQNSLDDVEMRKKNEASLAKRNQEMSILVSDLEKELQAVVTDRRELLKARDRMKAELECTILSLECCREDKLKLQNSLKESCEERQNIRVELDLVKRLLQNMASDLGLGLGRNFKDDNAFNRSIGELLEDVCPVISIVHNEKSSAEAVCSEENSVANVSVDLADQGVNSGPYRKLDHMSQAITNRDVYLSTQDDKVENLLKEEAEQGTLLDNNAMQIAKIEKHFREQQRLMSGMELFHKQLDRLRSENLSFDINFEEYQINADLESLQRELLLLDVANEKLGSIFPTYRTLHGYGNTLERVLALEVELAEALQVKKKPESHLQSSFLKQYNDDEVIVQSFRDINELLKNMLELKKRNAAVESELQDMQGRYSQLSLKFAEVEGERQKLVMSLKNRRPKKS